MKDVQGELDRRNIPLKHVGIKDLRWPIALKDKERGTQNTVATVLAVSASVTAGRRWLTRSIFRWISFQPALTPTRKGALFIWRVR